MEWAVVSQRAKTAEEQALAGHVEALARRCRDEVHNYLKFVGDRGSRHSDWAGQCHETPLLQPSRWFVHGAFHEAYDLPLAADKRPDNHAVFR